MSISDYLKEALNSGSDDEITDVYVTLPEEAIIYLAISLEGNWKEIDNVWSARLDAADPKNKAKCHVHIAKTKHRSSKMKQVAWNDDGSRHDKKTFDVKLGQSRKVRAIARDVLGLGDTISLESQEHKQLVEMPLVSSTPTFSTNGKEAAIEFYVETNTTRRPAWLRW
ncbi:DUF6367 family protein [Pseudomonas sp. P9_31]|uniref:DUF6367 family protein n=1 Tax=Pseudomonas sp. P9_31 TaxID=3043448 RepID=UPI002A36B77F|nr:DUF6367 family protein [Pseudomonas sp. P9_31]WPN56360.1 DUF6367 family protein [Pseudomonas sp. P9_31]